MHVTIFTNPWYPEYINQTLRAFPEKTKPEAVAIANAIMTGAAFIAQALDNAFSEIPIGDTYDREGSTRDQLRRIALTLDEALNAFSDWHRDRDNESSDRATRPPEPESEQLG